MVSSIRKAVTARSPTARRSIASASRYLQGPNVWENTYSTITSTLPPLDLSVHSLPCLLDSALSFVEVLFQLKANLVASTWRRQLPSHKASPSKNRVVGTWLEILKKWKSDAGLFARLIAWVGVFLCRWKLWLFCRLVSTVEAIANAKIAWISRAMAPRNRECLPPSGVQNRAGQPLSILARFPQNCRLRNIACKPPYSRQWRKCLLAWTWN